jgi:hypothetical protein
MDMVQVVVEEEELVHQVDPVVLVGVVQPVLD